MSESQGTSKKIIVVLGMHRSGTSAITRSLEVLGVALGKNLLPAVQGDNDKGFWEDADLYRINERVLSKLDSSWHALGQLDQQRFLTNSLSAERDEATELLRQRLEGVSVFAFKDPRTANLLSFWQAVFRELKVDDRYLIAVRDPRSVADSLLKRNSMARQQSYCLWMKHLLNAVQLSADKPRLVVDYDLMLEDPGKQLRRISEQLSLVLPSSSSQVYKEYTKNFLSVDLCHSSHKTDLHTDKSIPAFVAGLYQLLQGAASDTVPAKLETLEEFQRYCSEFLHYPQLYDYIDQLSCDLLQYQNASNSYEKTLSLAEGRLIESRQYSSELLEKHKSLYSRFTLVTGKLESQKSHHAETLESQKSHHTETLESQKGRYLEALESQKIRFAEQLGAQRSDLEELQVFKKHLSIDLADAHSKAEVLSGEVSLLTSEGEKSKLRIEELKSLVKKREAELALRNNKLKLTHSSVSWRITKPIRFVARQVSSLLLFGRSIFTGLLRKLWHVFPADRSVKKRIANWLFSSVPALFKHTPRYHQWSVSKASTAARVPLVRNTPTQGVTHANKASTSAAEPEILISCWLAVDDPLIDGLTELSRQLNELGLRSLFVGKTRFFADKGERNLLPMPLLLSAGNYQGVEKSGPLPSWIADIYDNEFVWLAGESSRSEEQVRAGCNRAYYYWLRKFQENKPSYVLVWGATAPLSRLHILLCKTLMIPYLVLERGHFLGTLLVDSLGQGATSEKVVRPADLTLSQPKRINEILQWEKSVDEKVPYVSENSDLDEQLVTRINNSGKKIIFYMGANDRGAGCARSTSDPECCSFLFEDSFKAIKYIKSMVEVLFPDCLLLVKPHPSDKRDYDQFKSEALVIADGLNINRLIKLSDVCVSTSTTAFAKCVVEKKPILALAVSDISLKNIAYECHDLSAIPAMLRSALERDGFDAKIQSGFAYLETLFDTSLVSVSGDAPTRLSLNDICQSIYQRYLATTVPGGRRVTAGSGPRDLTFTSNEALIDVVVPVYGDIEVTRNCIDSVIAARATINYRILIINDASPVEGMSQLLESYKAVNNLVLLTNQTNAGFVGTANRGMSYSSDRDVILLNSDTLVASGWVDRLYSHANGAENVATVTPFSNNASIFSTRNYPVGFDLDENEQAETFDKELAKSNKGSSVEVPVGHGFCMFIRRVCLDRVGYFDQMTFGKGYSEEVDFCQRATDVGFKHLCATDVFVGHLGGVSFADSADDQRIKNRKIIQTRYPNYFSEVKRFINDDPLSDYREVVA